jgi:hypothetical protein
VSTVGVPPEDSFRIEDQFIRDLIGAADPAMRTFLVGEPNRAFISHKRT